MDEWEQHESYYDAKVYWDCTSKAEEYSDPLWEPCYYEELMEDENDDDYGYGDDETYINEEPSVDQTNYYGKGRR